MERSYSGSGPRGRRFESAQPDFIAVQGNDLLDVDGPPRAARCIFEPYSARNQRHVNVLLGCASEDVRDRLAGALAVAIPECSRNDVGKLRKRPLSTRRRGPTEQTIYARKRCDDEKPFSPLRRPQAAAGPTRQSLAHHRDQRRVLPGTHANAGRPASQ